jgi:hypothetical protein
MTHQCCCCSACPVAWPHPCSFTLTGILMEFVGGGLGLFTGCLFSNVEVAVAILPMIILPLMVFSGFFVNADAIPVYFSWIQ